MPRRTRLPQPLKPQHGQMWGGGQNGQGGAQGKPGVPLWPYSLAWLCVGARWKKPPPEGPWVPLGAVGLSSLWFSTEFTATSLKSWSDVCSVPCDMFSCVNTQVIKLFAVSRLCWMPAPTPARSLHPHSYGVVSAHLGIGHTWGRRFFTLEASLSLSELAGSVGAQLGVCPESWVRGHLSACPSGEEAHSLLLSHTLALTSLVPPLGYAT